MSEEAERAPWVAPIAPKETGRAAEKAGNASGSR